MRRLIIVGLLLAVAACGRTAPDKAETAEETAPVAADAASSKPEDAAAAEDAVPVEARRERRPARRAARRTGDGDVAVETARPDAPTPPRPTQTLNTFVQRAERLFEDADQNRDGVLSGAELDSGGRGARYLSRADRDGDGEVTRDEARRAAEALFRSRDEDGDGLIDADERPDRRP